MTLSSPAKVQGRKRGRPPKNSPRFIKNSKKTTVVVPKTPTKVRKNLFVEEIEEEVENEETVDILPNEKSKATLDGKRNIEDLRKLFRAWIG